MADNGNPLGTDLASAKEAIAAMMAPSQEDNAESDVAQESDDSPAEYESDEVQASEEYEADPDDEGYSDEELEAEPQETRTFRVKVNGEEIEVTEDELLNGYSRQQDYSRKTQELAERRKQIEALEAEIETERSQYAQLLPALKQQLEQQVQQEPDWDALYERDPIEATKLERQWRQVKEQRQAQIEAVEAEQKRLTEIQQQKFQAEQQRYLQEQQRKLPELIPEWKDTKRAQTESQELRDYLISSGFSEQDVSGITNAQVVAMARKAMMFDKGQTVVRKAKEQPKKGPKTLKAGSRGTQPRKRGDLDKAQQRLRQTGRVADAASIIKSLL